MRRCSGFPLAPVGSLAARQGAAMAHRRRVMRGRKGLAALGLVLMGAVMAVSIHVSNEVTAIRRHLAMLESQRRCAEAEGAELLAQWNIASSLAVLTERAGRELGLEVAPDPGLTLIAVHAEPGRGPDRLHRIFGGLGGADAALAAEAPAAPAKGSLISLEPRRQTRGARP